MSDWRSGFSHLASVCLRDGTVSCLGIFMEMESLFPVCGPWVAAEPLVEPRGCPVSHGLEALQLVLCYLSCLQTVCWGLHLRGGGKGFFLFLSHFTAGLGTQSEPGWWTIAEQPVTRVHPAPKFTVI